MATKQVTNTISKSGAIFFSSLCASTFGLGCWQAKRYFEKIDLVEERAAQLAQDPPLSLMKHAKCTLEERRSMLDLGNPSPKKEEEEEEEKKKRQESNNHDDGDLGYRPIMAQGVFRHEDSVLVGPRGPPLGAITSSGPNSGRSSGGMSSSPQGYYLITPLYRSNGAGTILVNRGWIPMHLVKSTTHMNNHVTTPSWVEPKGNVTVIGVQSKTEQPKFMSPVHDDKKHPKQLLWFDRNAIEIKTKTKGQDPLLMTETLEDEQENTSVPIKPSKQSVGEFKVTPSTHAGYALTWFGLSGAGMIMTRKLITRGR